MKRITRAIFPIFLLLAAGAALWYYWIRPAGSIETAWNNLINPPVPTSTVLTASGTVETTEITIAPEQSGKILKVNAQEGDSVKAGDVLVQLDTTLLTDQRAIDEINLESAKQALVQLTSPMTLANAQHTVAQDQIDLDSAQNVLNDQLYYAYNGPAIQNALSALTLATDKLKTARNDYNSIPGDPATSLKKATNYQKLYVAQQNYDNALFVYNVWSGKQNQQQTDLKTAALNLAQAKLDQDQTLVSVLTNGQIPDNATGPAVAQIQQAKLNIQMAQADLDLLNDQINKATVTTSADGVVMIRNAEPGSVVNAGAALFTLGRLDQLTITVYVPEDRIGEVMLGQSADVSVDSFPGIVFNAVVSYISDQAEFTPRNVQTVSGRKNTVFAVKLSLQNTGGKLKPGMPADVTFQPE